MANLKVPRPKILLPVLILIIIILVGLGLIIYQKQNKPKSNQTEIVTLSAQVGKLIELPSETPTVATVSDISKLSGQPFFAHAVNGDKVLIYQNAKKAILFRPSINKIIEVAFYNPTTANVSPTAAAQKVRVAIYNGTKTAGLAKSEGESLKSKYPNIEIADTQNAAGDYAKDLIVDVTGKNSAFVKTLADDLSGSVGSLPSTEARPDADILIILGAK